MNFSYLITKSTYGHYPSLSAPLLHVISTVQHHELHTLHQLEQSFQFEHQGWVSAHKHVTLYSISHVLSIRFKN